MEANISDKFESLWEDYRFRSVNNIPKLGFYSKDEYSLAEVKAIAKTCYGLGWEAATNEGE